MIKLGCKSETIKPIIDYFVLDIEENRKYKSKKKYNILFLATKEFQKGIYDLILAINYLIKQQINNFELNIVGNGPEMEFIKNEVLRLELKSFVKFHGTITDKTRIRKVLS